MHFPNLLRSEPFSVANVRLLDAARRCDHEYVVEHLWQQDRHLLRRAGEFCPDQLFENRVGMQILFELFRARASDWLPGHRRRILELGAGGGYLAYKLGQLGYDVTAVDASPARVLAYQRAHPEKRPGLDVRFVLGVSEDLPFDPESFDFVLSQETLEHVLDVGATLEEACRVAKPGALFLHQFPRGAFADGDNHLRHFDEGDVHALFDRHPLRLIELSRIPYLVGEPPENWFVTAIRV